MAPPGRLLLPDRLRAPDVHPIRLVGDHVVQDAARFGNAAHHPAAVHDGRLGVRPDQAEPAVAGPLREFGCPGARGDDQQPGSREHRGVRVRTASLPGPRDPVPGRARHPDDPGPAAARAGLRALQHAWADQGHRPVRGSRHGPRHLSDDDLPSAPVLPVDPPGPRGGGPHRRGRVLHDVRAGHAAARGTGPRGGRDPAVPGNVEQLLLAGRLPPGARPTTPCRWGSSRSGHRAGSARTGRR